MGWEHNCFSSAKSNRFDEFYTRYEDIENELSHYSYYFLNKTVLCNCDDVFYSNFVLYFLKNFKKLGLKRLIITGFPVTENYNKTALVTDITSVKNMDGVSLKDRLESIQDTIGNYMFAAVGDTKYCAGDFHSEESLALLEEADIVVTNPPFSLFKDFLPLLLKYDKKFIVVGNKNAITYNEIFPAIVRNKVWTGYTSINGGQWMILPKNQKTHNKIQKVLKDGTVLVNVAGVCWFTNLDTEKRHWWLSLTKKYSADLYDKYDAFDAININRVKDIPLDYDGIMGVPITFLDKYNSLQFEIIGKFDFGKIDSYLIGHPIVNGKRFYKRLAIRRKNDFSYC